ncbi:MAG: spore coat protein U domain-containing protein [Sphingomonas taxi]
MLLAVCAVLPGQALACTPSARTTISGATYSPAAVAAGKVPTLSGQAGLTCPTTVLVLLGGNYVRGTFASANAFKLKNGSRELAYAVFVDSGGTVPITQNGQIDYMQNNLLNLLGLLGGSSATLPLYVKPGSAAGLPYGDYVDTITVQWDWRICNIAYAAGACLGTLTQGTGRTDITVRLTVGPQDVTMTLSSVITWDPVNGTSGPFALPGAKGRTTLAVRNPDLVPLDAGSIALIYKVPAKASVALDGDGTTSATVVGFAEGSPASGTTLTYTAANSISDDVDFSADDGATWTYVPVPGNRVSEAAITHLRLRPRGAMKAGGTFTLSFPYLVR